MIKYHCKVFPICRISFHFFSISYLTIYVVILMYPIVKPIFGHDNHMQIYIQRKKSSLLRGLQIYTFETRAWIS